MFGIGGGELVFILFIVLMLFGSDKVPEMARTMGKAMAQLKNATNDIKSEIQKGAEANGFDQNTLNTLTGGINSEIEKAKTSLLGDTTKTFNGITDTFTSEVNKTKESVASGTTNPDGTTILEDITGPVKRQM
jgi:sec-independent protein translocase protein TatA